MASDEITIIHENRRVAAELSTFRKRSTSVIIDRAHHVNWKWFVQPTFNVYANGQFLKSLWFFIAICHDALLRIGDFMRCCMYSCSISFCLVSSLRPRPTCPPTQGGALIKRSGKIAIFFRFGDAMKTDMDRFRGAM